MKKIINRIVQEITIVILNLLGSCGVILILYGYLSYTYSSTWPLLEDIGEWFAPIVTILSTFFVVISIYLPNNAREPDFHSRWITAPMVVILVILYFIYMIYNKRVLPMRMVNGFAILGLSGALFRRLRFSERSQ